MGTVGIDERKEFVDTLFDTILATGAKTIEDLTAKGEPVIRNVFRKVIIENPGTRAAAVNLPDNILFDGAGGRDTIVMEAAPVPAQPKKKKRR